MPPAVTDLGVPCVTAAEVIEGGYQIVDVRSPGELSEGRVPGAVNFPLLDDAQRAAVGLAYKAEGASKARMTAMELVSPQLAGYLGSLSELARSQPRGRRLAIMCWRGGERSRNVVLLLALIGIHSVKVTGGYRAYRRAIVDSLGKWGSPVPVITLYGPTGAGKSALIRALQQIGPTQPRPRPWPLDLEALALHRGSLLGGLNQTGERRQKDFDSLLWEELKRPGGDYLVLEGEGGRIGGIHLPSSVAETIRGGIPVLVSGTVEDRSKRIIAEYGPEKWQEGDVAEFRRGLAILGKRLARETLRSLESAFDDGRFTDVVTGLLVGYYDPLYSGSCLEGRDFVLEFRTSFDPMQDAVRFAHAVARLMGEVPLSPLAPDR